MAKTSTPDAYEGPGGKLIRSSTTLHSLFSDDFGAVALDTTTTWDVIDGGLRVGGIVGGAFGQVATANIGTGTTGITDSMATASVLTVNMGTVANAERWYMSQQMFGAKEDILVLINKSQAIAANSIFIGIVEVDPVTQFPILNPNFAGEFNNRGGMEFGLTTATTSFQAEAIGDASPAKAVGGIGAAGAVTTTTQEYLIEIDSRDVIVSNATVDATTPKSAGSSRVSTQCPNDKKLYKLIMRFKNVSAPASNTAVVISRILVIDNYEQRVQVSSGEGDTIANKAMAVNVTSMSGLASGSNSIGGVYLSPSNLAGAGNYHKLTSAATTNATLVIAAQHVICGGYVRNRAASERYFKIYNKATAPTVSTDVPVLTFGIPAGGALNISDAVGPLGVKLGAGIAYAITGAYADSDTTAIAAGDCDVCLLYA